MKKINIGVVGLGFGREFAAIYCDHPNVGQVAICTRTDKTLQAVGDEMKIPRELRFNRFENMLACDSLDAIHIVTPIQEHYPQTIQALNAGKHVACTVPMALTVDECREIVRLAREKNLIYTMMETSIYTREFIAVKGMYERGELGRIQYIKGDHMQNMELPGWGGYWSGFPAFLYGTHVISPLLEMTGTVAETVRAYGSGRLSADKVAHYGCPYAVETAIFKLKNSDVIAEAHRCLFETIRQVRESFDVYGDRKSFEWETTLDEGHTIFEGIDDARKFTVPDTAELLPEEIRKYTLRSAIQDTNQPSFIQGAGHGGSHPHLCHAFVQALLTNKEPLMSAAKSANYTCAGICAQESIRQGSVEIRVPDFEEEFGRK